jgi:glycolate oxidase iron-sulfur subunit
VSILTAPENYELINTCNKCGFCQANCSVYKEVLNEAYATRGRLRLIKAVADGQLERTPLYEKIINSCLMCEECSKNCPSGVQGHLLIQLARQDLVMKKGLSLIKKIPIGTVLPNNRLRKLSFNSARLLKKIIDPLPSLQSYRGIDLKSIPIADEDFLSGYQPEEVGLGKKGSLKIGFFVGCLMNHTMPQVAKSIVRLLAAHDCEVVVPAEQRCCGTPAYTYGHSAISEEVALSNINLFNSLGVDKIVTGCASCGKMLKYYSRIFEKNAEIEEAANDFAGRVLDLSQLLIDVLKIDLQKFALPLKGKITYHDPCHLVRGQDISSQPRQIISGVFGEQFVEMPTANKCCGAAGMFQGFYPEEATAITNKKVASIQKSGADYVVTGCPACLLRIQGSLRLNNMPQKVVHLAQLLDPDSAANIV